MGGSPRLDEVCAVRSSMRNVVLPAYRLCRAARRAIRARSRGMPISADMDKLTHREVDVPTDLLAGLLMEQARVPSVTRQELPLTAKVYGVMAATTLLTFATLVAGYQYLFPHPLFA